MAAKNAKVDIPYWAQPAPEEPGLGDSAAQWLRVGAHALAPYATATAAATPFGVPELGAPALAAADFGAGAYNAMATPFGARPLRMPSEIIQTSFDKNAPTLSSAPQTPGQQVFSDVLQAGAGGYGAAKGFQKGGQLMVSPAAQKFMNFMGSDAKGQAAASAGGAAAPSVAANYLNVTDPTALTGLSLVGGLLGSKLGADKISIPTSAEVGKKSKAIYDDLKARGINIGNMALNGLYNTVNAGLDELGFIARDHPQVRTQLNSIQKLIDEGPMSFSKLDSLHSDIMAKARGIVNNDKTRMYMQELGHKVEDFMHNLTPEQLTSGEHNIANISPDLTAAKTLWRNKKELRLVEDATNAAVDAVQQARTSGSPILMGDALRDQFKGIKTNSRAFDRLSPDLQKVVTDIANGTKTMQSLGMLSALANGKSILAELGGGLGVAAYTQKPAFAAVGPVLAGVGGLAKAGVNALAKSQGRKAQAAAAGMKPGGFGWNLMSPQAQQVALTQQAVLAPQKNVAANKRRDTFETPWWAAKPK
jgi:hypothetical protein